MNRKLSTAHLIKKARLKAKLSQSALARKAGMAPESICRIEGGFRSPELPTVKRLAAALRVNVLSLLGDL
jgi:transcriptional regulator with XRE-family HTH domain